MSIPTNSIEAHNVTFGYSDSEDRLWIRLQLQGHTEARLWLTRRLCLAACQGIAQLIEKNTLPEASIDEKNQYLKKEFFEISKATWDPSPEPPKPSTDQPAPITRPSLCQSISIDAGNKWALRFKESTQISYELPLDRSLMQKILLALLKQAHRAGWHIPISQTWIHIA